MALWCARTVVIGAPPKGLAAAHVLMPALCAIQLAISGSLLAYIDQRQVIPGDYGTIWRAQVAAPWLEGSRGPGPTPGGPQPGASRAPGAVTRPAARTTGSGGVDKKAVA